MRIAVVSCVFPPEPPVSATTSANLAAALRDLGDHVTVICPFPNRPAGRVFPGYSRRLRQRSVVDGIEIVRCFSTISRSSTMLSRMGENVSFGLTSAIALMVMRRPDVVYLNTWPLVATSLCAWVARLRGVPFVVSVQDVYPESLVVQKRIAEWGFVAGLLRRIDQSVTRAAAAVVVLSRQWASLYTGSRRVAANRVHVVPNWVDAHAVDPASADPHAWRRAKGITDASFLVVYGGNVGEAAGVEELIEVFAASSSEGSVLLIAGDGASVARCEELAQRVAPGRVLFHRPWRAEETAAVLGAADLLAVPTRGRQSAVSVPSKLIANLQAARPVLAIAEDDSETAAIVRAAGAGWVVPPGDDEKFRESLEQARRLSESERRAKGEAGRRYATATFGREQTLEKLVAIVRGARP